jgi:hypothetical protein
MADVVVSGATEVVDLSKDTRTALPAGQSVATGDTAVLTPNSGAPFKGRYMLVRVEPGAASTLTVEAGVTGQTPANLAALGDLAVASFTADSVLQLELARYLQSDGTVRIAVGGTGPVVFSVVNLTKAA